MLHFSLNFTPFQITLFGWFAPLREFHSFHNMFYFFSFGHSSLKKSGLHPVATSMPDYTVYLAYLKCVHLLILFLPFLSHCCIYCEVLGTGKARL